MMFMKQRFFKCSGEPVCAPFKSRSHAPRGNAYSRKLCEVLNTVHLK